MRQELIVDPTKMSADAFKNAGMGLGFIIGCFLERRFIKFNCEGSVIARIIRYAVCAGIYLLLDKYIAPLISGAIDGGIGKACEQFLLILYITAGAPLIINGLNAVGKNIIKSK